jgi:hypothetical protein
LDLKTRDEVERELEVDYGIHLYLANNYYKRSQELNNYVINLEKGVPYITESSVVRALGGTQAVSDVFREHLRSYKLEAFKLEQESIANAHRANAINHFGQTNFPFS